jgi:hypothetical protein
MNDEQIVDLWLCFKEFLDKKQIDLAAEKFIDTLADYGVDDIVLKEALGNDDYLDNAITYYLDLNEDEDY